MIRAHGVGPSSTAIDGSFKTGFRLYDIAVTGVLLIAKRYLGDGFFVRSWKLNRLSSPEFASTLQRPPKHVNGDRSLPYMIRIANAQGFWGDSLEAPLEQLRGGPIDYLTLDYLAEVTMSILEKQHSRDPQPGDARDFVHMIERGAKDIVERRVKVVANAGGVNPETCARAVEAALVRAGYGGRLKIGVVTGDNILARLDELIAKGVELRNTDTGAPLS